MYLAPLTSVKKEIYRDKHCKLRLKQSPEKGEPDSDSVPRYQVNRERSPGKPSSAGFPTKHRTLASLDSQRAAPSLNAHNQRSSSSSDLTEARQGHLQLSPSDKLPGPTERDDQLSRLKQKVHLLPISDGDRQDFWDSMRRYKKMQQQYLKTLLLNHSSPMGFNIEAAWSKTVRGVCAAKSLFVGPSNAVMVGCCSHRL